MFAALRKRVPAQTVSGAMVRIRTGLFGDGTPMTAAETVPFSNAAIYQYHEGDVFLPGAGNWVFESAFELPLQTLWGNAFIRNPNTFSPLQPAQLRSNPNVTTNGLGGLQAGELNLQGLINPEGQTAPFTGDFFVPGVTTNVDYLIQAQQQALNNIGVIAH